MNLDITTNPEKITVTGFALAVCLVGALTLLGWHFDIAFLKSFLPNQTSMNPLTGITFILAGIGLFVFSAPLATRILGGLIVLVSAIRILGFFGFDIRLDEAFYTTALAQNRMAPNTAVCFFLAGFCLMFLHSRSPLIRRFVDACNIICFGISLIALTGYLYDIRELYGVANYVAMAFNTAVSFFFLSLGLLFIRRKEGTAAVFAASDIGGTVARSLIPVIVFIPLILGAVRVYGQKAGWFSLEFGSSLTAVLTMFILAGMTLRCARQLSAVDQALKKQSELLRLAEQSLKRSNETLEQRIEERVKELSQAREQVEQLQKLDAVGRLAGGIAHDFNNILSVMKLYCELMARDVTNSEIIKNGINHIQEATTRGAALTKQLLIFSRKKVIQKNSVQMNEVVLSHLKMLKRLIGENISLEFKPAANLPFVLADVSQIEQVLMNLMINARDAMPQGGRMIIETHVEELDEQFVNRHTNSIVGPNVVLTITDTGTGMDAATQARIFEPFFTTKESGQGTGLGLATVYSILKSISGTVSVQSEVGKGSIFKVYIPVHEKTSSKPSHSTDIKLEGLETIMVVEDEKILRNLCSEVLKTYGYRVLVAENGKEALKVFESRSHAIDLVLTDMIMPELSGSELTQKVLDGNINLKVLCMSGYPGEKTNLEILDQKRVGYIQKPFNSDELLTKIRKLLDN